MTLLLLLMSWATLNTEVIRARWAYGTCARDNLVDFARLTSPLPSAPMDVGQSQYRVAAHHRFVAAQLARVESGEINRLLISLPYRHGKTELGVRKFVPWLMGRNPRRSVIVVTHSDSLAWEHGRDCRNVFRLGAYRLAFPEKDCQLREDSQARDRLQLAGGGMAMFTGRGGLGGGFGADIIIFDDFFKNAEEAQSEATRDHAWQCYVSDCKTRLNEESGAVIMIGTRKHEDDVAGRILDTTNPHYDAREAASWTVIRLPALAEPDDPLGRPVDAPLWPERFSYQFWDAMRTHASELVRLDFQTQAQCNPTPAEGKYFKRAWLKTYEASELPKRLRIYGASDHAYRKDQENDLQCLLVVGVDASDVLWVLPDTWWERAETDVMIERMVDLMESRKPEVWWAARDAISGSVGPFLKKRMAERKAYHLLDDEIREDKDLQRRAQSIRNRMAMGMVRFPKFAPWWARAETELVTFPSGKHDDLVAALALLGMGLERMVAADGTLKQDAPKPRTFEWIRQQSLRASEAEERLKATAGW